MKKNILLLIILLSIQVVGKSQDYSDYTKCSEQDSLALVAFYWATDGPNWSSNTITDFGLANLQDDVLEYYTTTYPNAGLKPWFDGPVKDWFGVTLEKQQIGNTSDSAWRVIHLHPTVDRRSSGQNNLSGYVPKEVGLLTALEWFKINGNTGLGDAGLPDEIYLPNMVEIDIESTSMKGDITEGFRRCTQLEFINLRKNFLDTIPNLDFCTPEILVNAWQSVFLYDNQLSFAILEPIVDFFKEIGKDNFEIHGQVNVGREQEYVISQGDDLTLTCNEAGSQGDYLWYKDGFSTYQTGNTFTISDASASDTGIYQILVDNDYVRFSGSAPFDNNVFTKPIHVTFIPTIPIFEKSYSSYDGNSINLEFSKPMAVPSTSQKDEFVVLRDGVAVPISGLSRTGRLNNILVVELEESLFINESITISYTKGSIVDINGGELDSFSDVVVANYTRETPHAVSAITRVDGEGIIIEFDHFIDPETFDPADFTITCTNPYSVEEIILVPGEIDLDVSKKITLILDNYLWETDVLSVSYTKGSLTGLYSGAVQSFADTTVENVVSADRLPVNISVVDGSKLLEHVVVNGDFSSRAVILNDAGENGDLVANDNIWTKTVQLNEGEYNWEVFARNIEITYDTVITTGGSGETIITLTPIENITDSLISDIGLNISRTGLEVTGDSIFEYRANSLVFMLDLADYIANNADEIIEPYLMGINDDWVTGIQMSEISSDKYTSKVSGFAKGDIVNYNYRNATIWENTNSSTRSHTVAGNDTIYNDFGVFPLGISSKKDEKNTVILYPNPASDKISVLSPNGQTPVSIRVLNIYGQAVYSTENTSSPIDISTFQAGMYILISTFNSGEIFSNQFIKSK
jgi:hypothetical protein